MHSWRLGQEGRLIIPPLHRGIQNTWSFSLLPQSHADKLMNTGWIPTGSLCGSLHKPERMQIHFLLTTLRRNGGVTGAFLPVAVSQKAGSRALAETSHGLNQSTLAAMLWLFFCSNAKNETALETKGNRAS